ncbi:Nucleotidyltransferase family protein [Rhodovastum atsumiense]|uniref:Nucleotidyltransferase family protein n=1 Tax=Rhodovastum atsumiense TaxID=504468 RepID=A0A5M6IKJ7_9PROT|nr:nucleotidyltransferase family protein [Rhodovastum atsumiense]KAA5608783.1 nucleotidyltransferase family protein [Rhodovastum atsumiense]CAH2602864.1 Nucleotidyltransferase family protein [Rhodovastum atsumiense]
MEAASRVERIIRADPLRWHILGVVRDLRLPDCWIGAGFVRNAVWDRLHRRTASPLAGDVDVVWHDLRRDDPREDERHEALLRAVEPGIVWSVRNQARMHGRNGDAPYASVRDAMRFWPETATAVAVRRDGLEGFEIAAPYGLDDLLNLVLRPTPPFAQARRSVYAARLHAKRWQALWPLLRQAEA